MRKDAGSYGSTGVVPRGGAQLNVTPWLCGSLPSEWVLVDDVTDTRECAAICVTSAPESVTACECRELEMSRMSAAPAPSWAAVITATCGSG